MGVGMAVGEVDRERNIGGETSIQTKLGQQTLNEFCILVGASKTDVLKLAKQTSLEHAIEVYTRKSGVSVETVLSFQDRKRMLDYIKKYSKAFGKVYNVNVNSPDKDIKDAAYEIEGLISEYNKKKAMQKQRQSSELIRLKLIVIDKLMVEVDGWYTPDLPTRSTRYIDGVDIYNKDEFMEYLSNKHIHDVLDNRLKHITITKDGRLADYKSVRAFMNVAFKREIGIEDILGKFDKNLEKIGYSSMWKHYYSVGTVNEQKVFTDNFDKIIYMNAVFKQLNIGSWDTPVFNLIINTLLERFMCEYRLREDNTDVDELYKALKYIGNSSKDVKGNLTGLCIEMLTPYIKADILNNMHSISNVTLSHLIKLVGLLSVEAKGLAVQDVCPKLVLSTVCTAWFRVQAQKQYGITRETILTNLGLQCERFASYSIYMLHYYMEHTKTHNRVVLKSIIAGKSVGIA